MVEDNLFSEDYYERGVEKHISGYSNYSWMPERSYPEAVTLYPQLKGKTVLDYGCAKGYLVAALRGLGIDAHGEDLSKYAISHAHPEARRFVSAPTDRTFDYVVCKDVMEHVPTDKVPDVLRGLAKRVTEGGYFVIPLGDYDKFRIREYEMDITHVTKKDEAWWSQHFRRAGFDVEKIAYQHGDIKKKWVEQNPYGNGFFWVRK